MWNDVVKAQKIPTCIIEQGSILFLFFRECVCKYFLNHNLLYHIKESELCYRTTGVPLKSFGQKVPRYHSRQHVSLIKIAMPYDPVIPLLGIYLPLLKKPRSGAPQWLGGLKPLPLAQVMIPGSQDRAQHLGLSAQQGVCFPSSLSACLSAYL